ncbi:hypothetical protein PIB30_098624 [Stylosanthes scabra]|uniref:Uncharacterized protein n=1 Tax=Stylosanthes scabra TaxID=79078 RepID=A0ABU6RXB2_9FABA|nr:hypothetical protein [Stylosanthes scabra]
MSESGRSHGCMGVVMVITIHPPLPAAITFAPELQLTHRLRLHEACSILFDSIPTRKYGPQLMMYVQVVHVARIRFAWMVYLDTQWREEHRM